MPDSVFRIKDGKVTMVVSRDQLGAEPNGIALSPDDKYLYLSAGTMSPDPKIMRYPVHPDGSVGPGELFTHGRGIGDGMKTDRAGNLWSTEPVPGNVQNHFRRRQTPRRPASADVRRRRAAQDGVRFEPRASAGMTRRRCTSRPASTSIRSRCAAE